LVARIASPATFLSVDPENRSHWRRGRLLSFLMKPIPTPRVFPLGGLAAAWVCVVCASPSAMADKVAFLDGGGLSGNVLSIQGDGSIQLDSPLAAGRLSLLGDTVERIEFNQSENIRPVGNTRFELSNSDFLMGRLLGYSRETGARILADGIGEILLPAGSLRSMGLEVQSTKIIYNGPDSISNWTVSGQRGSSNWQFNRQRLSATGSGHIGRMLDLPDRYVIRMRMHWQGQPNFQLGFSDPLEDLQVRVDRYYLQFGRAGIEIKRETAENKRWHTLATLNRTPDQFQNQEMEIELRVDRTRALIYLAINGNQEGRFMDHIGNPPASGGISLRNSTSNAHQLDISKLVVESWGDSSSLPSLPKLKVAGDRDSLVMREGDHYRGAIQSIEATEDGLVFSMNLDFSQQPAKPTRILGDDVAIVGFANGHEQSDDGASGPRTGFVLQIHDRGRLSVTQSTFDDGRVRALHPILGELTLPRASVSSLERQHPEEQSAAKR